MQGAAPLDCADPVLTKVVKVVSPTLPENIQISQGVTRATLALAKQIRQV